MDCNLPGSSIPEISQARTLGWVAISFSRGSSWPRDRICISYIGRFFTTEPPGKPFVLTWIKMQAGIPDQFPDCKPQFTNEKTGSACGCCPLQLSPQASSTCFSSSPRSTAMKLPLSSLDTKDPFWENFEFSVSVVLAQKWGPNPYWLKVVNEKQCQQ